MSWKMLSILAMGSCAIALSSCTPTPPMTKVSGDNPTSPDPNANTSNRTSIPQQSFLETNLDEQGRALRGYDPVAYFSEGKAIPGQTEFSLSWNNSTWLFSSPENRDEFVNNPKQYAPANGGYCTFGVVLGKKFDGDPEVWSLLNGYLYIFLNEEVREKFFQDEVGNLRKVVKNWPLIKDKAPDELN